MVLTNMVHMFSFVIVGKENRREKQKKISGELAEIKLIIQKSKERKKTLVMYSFYISINGDIV